MLSSPSLLELLLSRIAGDRYGLELVGKRLYRGKNDKFKLVVFGSKLDFKLTKDDGFSKYTEAQFLDYYQECLAGVIIADADNFWYVTGEQVAQWHSVGLLKNGSMPRAVALRALAALPDL